MNPDASGTYIGQGFYATKPYYRHPSGNWWIWWSSALATWILSDTLGGAIAPADTFWAPFAHGTRDGTYWPGSRLATGTPVPNVTGDFTLSASYDSHPVYKLTAQPWYIWRDDGNSRWVISNEPGAGVEPTDAYWAIGGPNPDESYEPMGTAEEYVGITAYSTGQATVAKL